MVFAREDLVDVILFLIARNRTREAGQLTYYLPHIYDSTAKRVANPPQNGKSLIQSAHVQKKHKTPTTCIDQRRQ